MVTTIYNYFGFTSFTTFFPIWKEMGLLSDDWHPNLFIDTINAGINDNIFPHPLIREVAQYSEFVDFHVKLNPHFMKEFGKVKSKYFPGESSLTFVSFILFGKCLIDFLEFFT